MADFFVAKRHASSFHRNCICLNKKFILLLGFAFSAIIYSTAQTLRRPVAAAYLGNGAYSINHGDVFSFTANQAALAQLKNISAGIYGERRFLLAELNNYTAAIGIPTTSGNFGLKAVYSGFTDYNETQLGLAYGRSLGQKIDIGVQFNYHGIKVGEYGSGSAISFEIGTLLHLSDKLNAGIQIRNPAGGKFGKEGQEKLPFVYAAGVGYDASDKFFISVEIEKEEGQPVNINAGFQYKFIPLLSAKAGISSATSTAWLGVGVNMKSFSVNITTSYHPQLGISPGLLFLFNFKKNKSEE